MVYNYTYDLIPYFFIENIFYILFTLFFSILFIIGGRRRVKEGKNSFNLIVIAGIINIIWILSEIFIFVSLNMFLPRETVNFMSNLLPYIINLLTNGMCLILAGILERSENQETKSLIIAGSILLVSNVILILYNILSYVFSNFYVTSIYIITVVIICEIVGGFFVFNYGRVMKYKHFTLAGLLMMLNVIFWFWYWWMW